MSHRTIAALVLAFLAAATPAAAPTLGDLEQATRLTPRSAEAWDRYGQALAQRGRFAEAHKAFATALNYAPDDGRVLHHIALAYAWSGNYREAARRYAALTARFPDDAELRIDYGQTLAWARQYKAARTQYEKVLARSPTHVEALRHLGMLAAWEGQYDEALRLLARAVERDPRNLRVLMAQGEVLSWKGDLAQAAAILRQIVDLAPKQAGAWEQLGQVQLWQGRFRDAQDSYRQALELEPQNLDALLGLARCYRETRDYPKAEQVLKSAQALFPAEARVGRELATLAAERELKFGKLSEYLQPLLFVVILTVIFYHVRRYRRVLSRRSRTLRALLVLLPLLAGATLVTLGVIQFGGAYYPEVQTALDLLELLNLATLLSVVFTLVWWLRFDRAGRHQVVLAIGAHPDDIEFGCGATLLRYREEGCQTHALILTRGEQGMNGNPDADTRVAEAGAAARVLALTSIEIRDLPDTKLREQPERLRIAIEQHVGKLQPDIIFTHTLHDVHSDHRAVFEATCEAARGPCTLLCYENPNTPPSFTPGVFVDVSDYLDDKIAALLHHHSQLGKPYADPAVVRYSAGFRGAQAHVRYAEAFEAIRVLDKKPAGTDR